MKGQVARCLLVLHCILRMEVFVASLTEQRGGSEGTQSREVD